MSLAQNVTSTNNVACTITKKKLFPIYSLGYLETPTHGALNFAPPLLSQPVTGGSSVRPVLKNCDLFQLEIDFFGLMVLSIS